MPLAERGSSPVASADDPARKVDALSVGAQGVGIGEYYKDLETISAPGCRRASLQPAADLGQDGLDDSEAKVAP